MMPTVSAIMPAYNVESYVGYAIDSVLAQTYEDWELIIVDDGSNDNTPQVLTEYQKKDTRIKVIFMRHGGRGKARNKCLEHVTGKYVAICDADDISLPTRFEKQVDFLERNPEYGVVSCSKVYCFDDNGNTFELISADSTSTIRRMLDKNKMPLINPSVMIRNDLFKRFGGFDETLLRAQDYGFFKKISHHTLFGTIPEPLVLYRTQGLIPPKKVYYESELYRYYASYKFDGQSFDEFYTGWRHKLFKQFLVPAKYLWLQIKRRILAVDVKKSNGQVADMIINDIRREGLKG
jgi:glycosyltransferase involved in cell wall biosynthesis